MTRWRSSLSRNDDSNKNTEGQTIGCGHFRWVIAQLSGRALTVPAVRWCAFSSRLCHCPPAWPWARHFNSNCNSKHYCLSLPSSDFSNNWTRKAQLKHFRNLSLLYNNLLKQQSCCTVTVFYEKLREEQTFYSSILWNNIIQLFNFKVEFIQLFLHRRMWHHTDRENCLYIYIIAYIHITEEGHALEMHKEHNTVSLHTAYRQYFSVESLRSNSVWSFAFQLL